MKDYKTLTSQNVLFFGNNDIILRLETVIVDKLNALGIGIATSKE
jgi:hypothetical protein